MLEPGVRIPLADAASFAGALRRLRLVRLVLAGCLLAVGGGVFLAARGLSAPEAALVPPGSSGVVVLDVSSSIEAATYERREAYQKTARALEEAAASGGRYGVVLFSDVAYEALPATAPSTELRAFQRYFLPLPRDARARPFRTMRLAGSRFAANPWTHAFTAGTQISNGLRLARRVLRRDGVRDPVVVLVSDLNTDDSDVAPLSKVVLEYGRQSIPLRVVAVGASETDTEFFRRLTARAGVVVDPEPLYSRGRAGEAGTAASPVLLVALAGLLLALLALNELACARVGWRRRAVTG
ncbi:MAG: VWA domain-containing protein [Thermoleophilia bacterium]|nr:VWA domain-containing protein [Thermoleophilia bacterium]